MVVRVSWAAHPAELAMHPMTGGSMKAATQNRARYLSLAVEVGNAIDSLLAFMDFGRDDSELSRSLRDVIDSIRTVEGQRSSTARLRNHRSFGHFEQISTIDDVVRTQGQNISKELSGVLNRKAALQDRRRNAESALEFLFAVQNRALHRYNRPTPLEK